MRRHTCRRAHRKPAGAHDRNLAARLLLAAAMKITPVAIILSLGISAVAAAKGSPQNGVGGAWKFHYKTPSGEEVSGELHLARDKDVACGVYRYTDSDDWIGWASLGVKGNDLEGTYYETQTLSTWKFKVDK